MKKYFKSEVIVYHDETKDAGEDKLKGHVLLFIPVKTMIEETGSLFGNQSREITPLSNFFNIVENIREKYDANHKLHFADISGRKWTKRNEAEKMCVVKSVEALKRGNRNGLFCKLAIIFYPKPTFNNIKGYGGQTKREQELRYGETILRMLVKGAVHYLYDKIHKVKILKIITDGEPHHRNLSEFRILNKLIGEVRDYVEIEDGSEIVHLPSNHKNYNKGSEDYIHANMLQLADMLLGSSIHCCLKRTIIKDMNLRVGDRVKDKKGIIAYSVKEMLDKRKRGKNFQYSSHYRSFTISKAIIGDGDWKFENVMTKEIQILQETGQINLFDLL